MAFRSTEPPRNTQAEAPGRTRTFSKSDRSSRTHPQGEELAERVGVQPPELGTDREDRLRFRGEIERVT